MTKDVISLSISVLLLFRHYISHKITFGAPSSGGVLGQKKKYVCLLFDENFKQGRSVDFLFYFIFIFYFI